MIVFKYKYNCLQEAGIPIDMVGGVSIGAFMGALWCMERNITIMTQKAREWSQVCKNKNIIYKIKNKYLHRLQIIRAQN